MKQQYKKATTLVLVAALLFSCVGCATKASDESKEEAIIQEKEKKVEDIKTTGHTVYIFSNEEDTIKKIVATDDILDHIKDPSLKQDANLLSLEKELPISIKTTYYLNGKKINKKELTGKTGELTIRYDYINQQSETVLINGKNEQVYVPYAMISGAILDDENFSNVTISNGKIIDDGNHTILLGLALPGLQENLLPDNKDINIPSSLEVHATIKNYQPIETISMATNKVFHEVEFDGHNDFTKIEESLHKLDDAMNQLIEGSSQLYKGLSLLDENSDTLAAGVEMLCQGSVQLSDGTSQLQEGSKQLAAGATTLYNGLATLCDNNETLQNGALEVFHTLLSTANAQLKQAGLEVPTLSVENFDQVLTKVIASLDADKVYQSALNEVTKQVEAQRPMITQKVTAAVQAQVTQKVTLVVQEQVSAAVTQEVHNQVYAGVINQALHMSVAQYEQAVKANLISKQVQEQIHASVDQMMKSDDILAKKEAAIKAQMQSEAIQKTIAAQVAQQMKSDAIQAMIKQQTDLQVEKAISDIMASDMIQDKFAQAEAGLKSIIELKTSLNKYNVFYKGILQYTNGVAQAYQGSAQLKDGIFSLQDASNQLHDGAMQLQDGLFTLQGNIPTLKDGISQLKNGSKQLADGIVQFNDEGIAKIMNAYNGDVKTLADRLKATLDAKESFAGINQSSFTYIYR